jgi:hypothetical protein
MGSSSEGKGRGKEGRGRGRGLGGARLGGCCRGAQRCCAAHELSIVCMLNVRKERREEKGEEKENKAKEKKKNMVNFMKLVKNYFCTKKLYI